MTNQSEIKGKYKVFPYYNKGRIYVSPAIGCPSGCIFCYLFDMGYGALPITNILNITDIISDIQSQKSYTPGKEGTLLSIGYLGDPFSKDYTTKTTVEWLTELLKLGNPIQLVTRFKVSARTASMIAKNIQYKNQLSFSVSISSFSNWKILEPNADSPKKRLGSIASFKQANIPTNIYIKPFFPGITEKDIDTFTKVIHQHKIDTCVVGTLYLNDKIHSRLSTKLPETKRYLIHPQLIKGENIPCISDKNFTAFNGTLLDDFCNNLRKSGIKVFKNSACVNAWLLQASHVGNLKDNPNNLCVDCGVCDSDQK